MNTSGKTLTIFLVIISILLLSLTAITIFFFQKEREMRKTAENSLETVTIARNKLDSTLKEAEKKIRLLEEENKQADDKINNLLDELDLAEGVSEQLKLNNVALQEQLNTELKNRETIQKDLITAQEEVATIKKKLVESEKARTQLESKIEETQENKADEMTEAAYEKIVVTPGVSREGAVLRIDHDNHFIICGLGSQDGIAKDMVLSVYRDSKYLGDVTVARVQTKLSVGDCVPPLTTRNIKVQDRVVVKE